MTLTTSSTRTTPPTPNPTKESTMTAHLTTPSATTPNPTTPNPTTPNPTKENPVTTPAHLAPTHLVPTHLVPTHLVPTHLVGVSSPLTTSDLALLFSCSPRKIRSWAKKGYLSSTRTASGARLFDQDSVESALSFARAHRDYFLARRLGAELSAELRSSFARLDELASLGEGWLDGYGLTPSSSSVALARHLVASISAAGLPRPLITPTEMGGIQLEWPGKERYPSIEIGLQDTDDQDEQGNMVYREMVYLHAVHFEDHSPSSAEEILPYPSTHAPHSSRESITTAVHAFLATHL